MPLDVRPLALSGLLYVKPRKFADGRGFFSETYNAKVFKAAGIPVEFVQDNHSFSADAGTVRGLHFQSPPFAQDKLLRVVSGRILDVCVDIRRNSPTYGQHLAVELSSAAWDQLFVPIGFAHGFCTLEPNTEVLYKVSHYYAAEHDHGVLWSDPVLKIDWPVAADKAVVSEKDRTLPMWRDISTPF